jgi:DNA-binding SARP family transcriptional activator/TolB-like protein
MSKLAQISLRLLGAFAVEADVGRPLALSIRSKKARALLAYLAMKPDYRARREELATLLWGDNPDALARQSLRQCLNSLRQDLSVAAEALIVDREAVGLNAQLIGVDARKFLLLARSAAPDELAAAAQLWHGAFLSDLTLDIEEFDAWQRQEADRLAGAAAGVFEARSRHADAGGDGAHAIAAAELLVALEPTREDRQRAALKLVARYQGREAALSRVKQLTDLLRTELGVAPEAATRSLVEAIKRGDFESAPAPEQSVALSTVKLIALPDMAQSLAQDIAPLLLPVAVPSTLPAVAVPRDVVPAALPFWRRPMRAASWRVLAVVAVGAIAIAVGLKWWWPANPPRNQAIAVLPFSADGTAQSDDPAFARALTHNVIGYLSRFGNLRVISEQTSEAYAGHQTDVARLMDFGVRYAIVGHVDGNDSALKINLQLVDTMTRTNVWSDQLQRQRGDAATVADEASRGIARMLAIQIGRLSALRITTDPNAQLTLGELMERGYLVLDRGTRKENLVAAMKSFDAALQRNPRYLPARLAVARIHITATMNFIDLDPAPDLRQDEQLLNETLARFPNSVAALYSLALLQKHRHQYQAALQSFQRCLEINPSFLPAQGQLGDMLTRLGQPQQGLDQVLQTIRAATPNDPTVGYWDLFAAEAELELGHDQAALDWALRANTFMPSSALVQAWLASIYATAGDKANAAKYVAALAKMAPGRIHRFLDRPVDVTGDDNGRREPRILNGLRLALGETPG